MSCLACGWIHSVFSAAQACYNRLGASRSTVYHVPRTTLASPRPAAKKALPVVVKNMVDPLPVVVKTTPPRNARERRAWIRARVAERLQPKPPRRQVRP